MRAEAAAIGVRCWGASNGLAASVLNPAELRPLPPPAQSHVLVFYVVASNQKQGQPRDSISRRACITEMAAT